MVRARSSALQAIGWVPAPVRVAAAPGGVDRRTRGLREPADLAGSVALAAGLGSCPGAVAVAACLSRGHAVTGRPGGGDAMAGRPAAHGGQRPASGEWWKNA